MDSAHRRNKMVFCHFTTIQSTALRIGTFIATIMVVLRHSQNLHLYYEGGNPFMPICDANVALQRLNTEITHIAIPAFFLISGFLFFRNIGSWQDCIGKWQSRVKSLLLPYILWNLVSVGFWLCVSLIPALRGQLKITFELEYSSVWFLRKLTYAPIVGQFWYIRTLILFLLATPLIWWILRSNALSLVCIGGLVQIWQPIDTRILSTEGALFFFVGSWMACHCGLPASLPRRIYFGLLLPIVYGLLTNLGLVSWRQIPSSLYIGLMLYVGWQCCLRLAKNSQLSEFLQKWHRHSFFLYALHGFVDSSLSVLISRVVMHNALNSMLMYVAVFMMTILICFAVSLVMMRLLPKYHSIFSGGR